MSNVLLYCLHTIKDLIHDTYNTYLYILDFGKYQSVSEFLEKGLGDGGRICGSSGF
jgi:hypothetical protein